MKLLSNRAWQPAINGLSDTSLQALIDGQIPAIHIANAASQQECQQFCQAVRANADRAQTASTSPMQIIGTNFMNFHGCSKTEYFAAVAPAYGDLQQLCQAAFDPLQRMLDQLQQIWPGSVGVATEPGFGSYFAGNVKSRVHGSQLHFDYIARFTSAYDIAESIDQLAWNLYLEMPQNTGATTVYNAAIDRCERAATDAIWNNKLDLQQVADVEHYRFQPQEGEIVLFNSRFAHTIEVEGVQAGERRIQVGSFIGRKADNSLHLWS